MCMSVAFFVKQKTAYEMRISDWSSDVCSSDRREIDRLVAAVDDDLAGAGLQPHAGDRVLAAAGRIGAALLVELLLAKRRLGRGRLDRRFLAFGGGGAGAAASPWARSLRSDRDCRGSDLRPPPFLCGSWPRHREF